MTVQTAGPSNIGRGGAAVGRGGDAHPPTVSSSDSGLEITYRGRRYELLPVSHADGIRLRQAAQRIQDLPSTDFTRKDIARYRAALRLVLRLAARYTRPHSFLSRLLRRNPFRGATEAELGALLGALLASSMTSSLRVQP